MNHPLKTKTFINSPGRFFHYGPLSTSFFSKNLIISEACLKSICFKELKYREKCRLNVIKKFKIFCLGILGSDGKNLYPIVLFFAEIKATFICEYYLLDCGPAFFIEDNRVNIDPVMCSGCSVCAQICPEHAILPIRDT